MKNKKASEIKWSASVKMANGGFMNKFATGGSEVVEPCPDGQIYDIKLGRCVTNAAYSVNRPNRLNDSLQAFEENKKYSEANDWMKAYMASPMYKSMLYNSTTAKGDPNYNVIFNGRNKNLASTPPLQILPQPADSPRTNGSSTNSTGQIELYPVGFNSSATLVHELSHSVDRPVSDFSGRLIPWADQTYINNHKAKSFKDSRDYHNNIDDNKYYEKEYPEWFDGVEKDFKAYSVDYVGQDTETRARLNAIRQLAQKAGLYDPFKEKVSSDTYYKKLKNFQFQNKRKEGSDPMKQLQKTYSDDEIIYMLNNISKNEVQQEQVAAEGQAKNGGSIKWSANTKMALGGFMNQFAAGGQPPCSPGETVDPKTGLCIRTIDLPEVMVFPQNSTARKLQGSLTDKLQQIRTAFQNSRARNFKDGDKYNFGLNLGPETNDPKKLPGRIARYKQAIELEKINYARDKKVFEQLQQFDPDYWGGTKEDLNSKSRWSYRNANGERVEKRHQSEARTAAGLATLRNAMKAGKLSKEDFMYAYNDWGKDVDQNAVQGKGPGAVYNNKAADEKWGDNMNKESFKNVALALNGAGILAGAGFAAPLIPLIGQAASTVGTAIAPAYTSAMGTTVSQIPGLSSLAGSSSFLPAAIGNVSVGNVLGASSMYNAGKNLINGSTYEANKKVYDDMKAGEFNPTNFLNAASKDLSLLTNFSKVLPVPDLKLDKTRALVNVGQTVADPGKFDALKITKGLVAAGNKKYGGIVNNILKKYPNFNIHNNALDIYLNGGSVT